jgi:plastocyanin domain-containing protein
MSADELFVVAVGLAAIAWINWYFFFARRPSAIAVGAAGGWQEVKVTVRGGYDPAVVRVRRGAPVRLIFDRQETSGCSEEVVIPAFGIRKYLPAHQQTAIEFTPSATGTFEFTCGMSMLRGTLAVEANDGESDAEKSERKER